MNSKKLIIICAAIIISIVGVSSVLILTHNSQEETELSITSPSTIVIGDNVSVKLAAENGTSIANQTINISLISPDGKKITVNAVTDDEGIASYGISDISAGNYTLECLFEGNDEYKESNATSKLEIREVDVNTNTNKNNAESSNNGKVYDEENGLHDSYRQNGKYYINGVEVSYDTYQLHQYATTHDNREQNKEFFGVDPIG